MTDLFDGYRDLVDGGPSDTVADGPAAAVALNGQAVVRPAARAWDEMLSVTSRPRKPYRAVHATLRALDSDDLVDRAEALARTYLDQGVTFDFAGEERPFPLDVVPRVVSPEEWQFVEAGVAQRVRVLEAFLADIYGPREVVKAKVVPWRVIASASGFHRIAHGLRPANGVRIHVAGIDLIRDEDGAFRVLEDNVRVPSGVSYVMANRRAMATVFPESFATHRIRPVDEYPHRLLAALRAAAPDKSREPTVVVLTPGIYNSAYFEHTLLARTMGVELVEGRDLYCSGGRVLMRTTDGQQQVDVIYRRVDDDFLDPVQFRADSMLGTPGLVNAVRAGNVAIANAIGNGVADDKLIYTYVPDLCRFYLGEEILLPNVQTYRLAEPADLAEVIDRLHELVLKPVDGAGGKGLVIGPKATREQLVTLRAQIEHDPRGWIAQPVVQLSTVPTLIDGTLRPRHVDLRPFAVNDGRSVWVLPGGLTRVALPEGQLVVNSSQGGGSKDTWVLSGEKAPLRPRRAATPYRIVTMPHPDPGPHEEGGGLQQQQQQQQQQHEPRCRQRKAGEPTC
ncbi:MAG: circularly permuted type 2 ATP-grasp protein [Kineosporiaceae bacterium]